MVFSGKPLRIAKKHSITRMQVSDNDLIETDTSESRVFWNLFAKHCGLRSVESAKPTELTRRLAKLYFARAGGLSVDFSEGSDLQLLQRLLLLSIFCQYELKPRKFSRVI
jgi:hypothetical protein